MSYERIVKIFLYPEIYEYLADGITMLTDLRKCVSDDGNTGGQYNRRIKFLMEEAPYVLNRNGVEFTINQEELIKDCKALIKRFCGESIDSRVVELEKALAEKDRIISELKDKTQKDEVGKVREEMEQKILVAGSVEVGPKKGVMDDVFLEDPHKLLDVDKLVTLYGGTLDSFYKDIPTDEEWQMSEEFKKRYEPEWREKYIPKFEPGKELTLDNYRSRIMKRIGTKKLFKKRLDEIEEAKQFEKEHGQLFPDAIELLYNPEKEITPRQKERNKILRERFESLNKLIESDEYTNQEKLMLFALYGNFRYREMELYLSFASQYCINANYLIYILQGMNPNVVDNYTNMLNFLRQFKDPSEFRMKLDLARELIEGKWYITADYKGKKTKFQLVPIEEFNELRQKVGLPVSEFRYKGEEKQEDKEDDKADKQEEPHMPESVPRAADCDRYDCPDDGFEAAD